MDRKAKEYHLKIPRENSGGLQILEVDSFCRRALRAWNTLPFDVIVTSLPPQVNKFFYIVAIVKSNWISFCSQVRKSRSCRWRHWNLSVLGCIERHNASGQAEEALLTKECVDCMGCEKI